MPRHVLLTEPPLVGGALRRLRERRDLSIAAVARKVGVSPSYLQQIETGGRVASWALAHRVCRTLGTTLLRLLDGIDSPLPPRDGAHLLPEEHATALAGDLPDAAGDLPDPPTQPTLLLRTPWREGENAVVLDLRLPPHSALTDEAITFEGTIIVTEVQGRLLLELDGDEHDLRAGHGALFNARRPHLFRNYTDSPCRALLILAPPML